MTASEIVEATESETGKKPRPEAFVQVWDRFGFWERFSIRFIRASFDWPRLDRLFTWCQRNIGQAWVHYCTKNLQHIVGLERVGPLNALNRVILVSNHRSFFDMYVINTIIFRNGFRERLLFPVRSNFFYDHPLGFVVNGLMSFWSMYPPIFREKKRAMLTHVAFSELSYAVTHWSKSIGMHPEGRRNTESDPYTLLPAQPGVGRLIHLSRATVLPVFINGLGNNLPKQIAGNFNGKGDPVVVVFGAPINFGELLDAPASSRTYRLLAERVHEVIAELGQEERAIRANLGQPAEQPGRSI